MYFPTEAFRCMHLWGKESPELYTSARKVNEQEEPMPEITEGKKKRARLQLGTRAWPVAAFPGKKGSAFGFHVQDGLGNHRRGRVKDDLFRKKD